MEVNKDQRRLQTSVARSAIRVVVSPMSVSNSASRPWLNFKGSALCLSVWNEVNWSSWCLVRKNLVQTPNCVWARLFRPPQFLDSDSLFRFFYSNEMLSVSLEIGKPENAWYARGLLNVTPSTPKARSLQNHWVSLETEMLGTWTQRCCFHVSQRM